MELSKSHDFPQSQEAVDGKVLKLLVHKPVLVDREVLYRRREETRRVMPPSSTVSLLIAEKLSALITLDLDRTPCSLSYRLYYYELDGYSA